MDKKELFNSIANRYDSINNAISLNTHKNFKRHAIFCIPNEHFKILDICCGTGDMTEFLQKKYPNANITGIDFSKNMLDIAKKRLRNINFIEHDVTELPFENETFDLCVISFGLRNVNDLKKVLREIHRVLKLGGIFFNLDLGKPNKFWNIFLKPYMYCMVPFLGKLACGNSIPLKYFVHSNETFPHPNELEKIYKSFGFEQIKRKDYLFGQISCQICKKAN